MISTSSRARVVIFGSQPMPVITSSCWLPAILSAPDASCVARARFSLSFLSLRLAQASQVAVTQPVSQPAGGFEEERLIAYRAVIGDGLKLHRFQCESNEWAATNFLLPLLAFNYA